jgi:hypothetical protein
MGILDKIFGHREEAKREGEPQQPAAPPAPAGADEQAIARYRYMLKTAPPEAIEQAHQEAFAALTPEQRKMVLQQLSSALPEYERPAPGAPGAEDPQALARMATRAEMRQPGTLERVFGSVPAAGGGWSPGALMGGSFLTSIAGAFIGTAIADHFFNNTMAGRGFFGSGWGGSGEEIHTSEGGSHPSAHAAAAAGGQDEETAGDDSAQDADDGDAAEDSSGGYDDSDDYGDSGDYGDPSIDV